jgi:hypothetical protein
MIDERRANTGMSWSSAARIVVAPPETVANDGATTTRGSLGARLASLQATSTFGVHIGKVRAWGFASEEPGGAVAEMREAQIKPQWWRRPGPRSV